MKYRTILLFGAPGAGKGTQGKILGTVPNFFHCACGEVFRKLKPDSELGKVFVKYSSNGKLVPNDFTVRLWRETEAAPRRKYYALTPKGERALAAERQQWVSMNAILMQLWSPAS